MDGASIEKLLDDGGRLLAEGDAAGALPLIQQAVERDKKSFTAAYLLGLAHARLEEYEKAVRAFEGALKVGESPDLWREYGLALLEMGSADDGRRALRRAASLGTDPSPLFHVACSFETEGRAREGMVAIQEFLEKERDDPRGWELHDVLAETADAREEAAHFRLTHCDAAMLDLLESRRRLLESGESLPMVVPGQEGEGPNLKPAFCQGLGRVLLGSSGDDGVAVPPRVGVHVGVDHLGVTVARLLGLLETFQIAPGRVLPIDRESAPLAAVLADLLGAAALPVGTLPAADGRPLLAVQMQGRDYLLFRRTLEMLPRPRLSFVFALSWFEQGLTFDASHLPDVTGLVGSTIDLPPASEVASEAFQGFLRGSVARHRPAEREAQVAYHAGRKSAIRFPDLRA